MAGSGAVMLSSEARLGIIDEVLVENGKMLTGRRLNGDETFSGNLFALDIKQIEVRKVVTYTLQSFEPVL